MTSDRTGARTIDPDRADPQTSKDKKAAEGIDKHRKVNGTLDEALKDSFPASDPPSLTQPGE